VPAAAASSRQAGGTVSAPPATAAASARPVGRQPGRRGDECHDQVLGQEHGRHHTSDPAGATDYLDADLRDTVRQVTVPARAA
jgi:hypothetical protein